MFWINKRGFFPNEILKTMKKYVNNTATGNLCIQFEVMLKAKDHKNYAQHATIVRRIYMKQFNRSLTVLQPPCFGISVNP